MSKMEMQKTKKHSKKNQSLLMLMKMLLMVMHDKTWLHLDQLELQRLHLQLQ